MCKVYTNGGVSESKSVQDALAGSGLYAAWLMEFHWGYILCVKMCVNQCVCACARHAKMPYDDGNIAHKV